MKNERKKSADTRHSLPAAGEIFVEKDYRDATIAAICATAKANIAAVNYHFGDKQNLYIETRRPCFTESFKAHPPDGGVEESAPAEARLQGLVTALLQRITDEWNYEFIIMQKERANPTGLLTIDDVEANDHHVVAFSLGGLQAIRETIEKNLHSTAVRTEA
ncbi:TetR family transcriptional regulator [bacterium]|nr:TetR family transcriptional regulator [bacterium]